MDEVYFFLGALLLSAVLTYWIAASMVKRHKLLRQIASRRERVEELREQAAALSVSIEVHERIGTIVYKPPEMADKVLAMQMEADGLWARVSVRGAWEKFASGFLSKKEEKLRVDEWYDPPFRAGWKLVYGAFHKAFPLLDTLFLLAPRNRARLLREELSSWELDYERYLELVRALEELSRSSLFLSQKKMREALAKKEEEEQRKVLEQLQEEANALAVEIRRAIWSHRAKLLALPESHLLDVDRVESGWFKKLEEAKEELEPESRVKRLLALTMLFEAGLEGKSRLISDAEKILAAEKSLRGIKDDLAAAGVAMGEEPQRPLDLSRAERLVKKVAPQLLYDLNLDALERVFERVRSLSNKAAIRVSNLSGWVKLILPLQDRIDWIGKMENVLRAHGVLVEPMKDWDKITFLLTGSVPTFWKEGKEKELNEALEHIQEALNLRITMLATRAGERAKEVSIDPDTPAEEVKKLRELQGKLLRGPEDEGEPIRFSPTSGKKPQTLAGDVIRSDMGTLMPAGYRETWEGSDARKKQSDS